MRHFQYNASQFATCELTMLQLLSDLLWCIELMEEPMCRRFAIPVLIAASTGMFSNQSAQAFNLGYSRGVAVSLESIHRMAFRGGKVAPSDTRSPQLVAVKAQVGE
jgi:hypothetical protein